MEQKQDIQNKPHNDQGEKQYGVSPAITGIAVAVWIFIGLTALLWFVIGNNIADGAKRFEIGVMAMLNIAIVVIVVFHAVIYHNQTKAMIAQSEIALRQFEITDRPWLSVDVTLVGPLTFTEQGANLTFRIVLKNVGRSVAVNATINAKVIVPNPERDPYRTVMAEHSRICQDIHSEIMSYALFPERSFIQGMSFGVGPQELEEGRWGDTKFIQVFFVGCVDYQFSGHSAHHQTRFSYQVHRTEPGHEGATFAILIGQDVPSDRLILYKTIVGRGDYAD